MTDFCYYYDDYKRPEEKKVVEFLSVFQTIELSFTRVSMVVQHLLFDGQYNRANRGNGERKESTQS